MKSPIGNVVVAALAAAFLLPAGCQDKQETALINVSYDPTRELYKDLSATFSKAYLQTSGHKVTINNSHGGSGAQARAVLGGLKADLVTLALASDIETLEDRGFVKPGWQSRFPSNSSPYTSSIVFLVRKGNPKGIKDWKDLIRPDVAVITPNPKTSGGARWNFLAAWGSVTQTGGDEKAAADFVQKLYARVPVLDTGARGSTTSFVQKKLGDVLLAWENEAFLALKEEGGDQLQAVYPDITILAEPPVAIVDKVVDQKGTRAVTEEFVKYLYTDEAQEIIARWGYRPVDGKALERHKDTLPPFKKMFTIKEVAGSWREAQKKFFADGGVFDQVYHPQ
ncbi:MAG TPA: sulfate ABC transporter substrate-binding protein [Planctomycetota bacterium]|jgi:sulfate transport system substrate-binding protein|nr:sulfate ABC transporter substrate-binding protein [Planctomycetota bacterium]